MACGLFAMRSEGIGWIGEAFRGNLCVEIDEGGVQGDDLCAVPSVHLSSLGAKKSPPAPFLGLKKGGDCCEIVCYSIS